MIGQLAVIGNSKEEYGMEGRNVEGGREVEKLSRRQNT
jgi:hypothetical protein